MEDTTLYMSFKLGNMVVWLWLEVLALGCLVLWTTNLASIIMVLFFKQSRTLRLRAKKTLIDRIPLNGDLTTLPTAPKLIITFIRAGVSIAVAFSALGIDPGNYYTNSQPSTHLVSATNLNFSGRAYDSAPTDSLQDFAVVACEDVTTTSVVKFMAIVSNSAFSCNFGRDVSDKKAIAEVIWDQDTVRDIAKGQALPVNIKLGENSAVLEEESSERLIRLHNSKEAPVFMSVIRRGVQNSTYGECHDDSNDDTTGQREYLVFSNGRVEDAGRVEDEVVSVAYVICKASSVIPLRNTDRMMFLPHITGSQQMILARQVAEALVSITADSSKKVFFGQTRSVTKLEERFFKLMLGLTIGNTLFLVVSAILLRYVKRDIHVDVLSPVSMYWLGRSSEQRDKQGNKEATEDVFIRAAHTANGIEIAEIPTVRPVLGV
ncbi:hypothetical protein BWQ96_03107 [Gracilariopsis chorda]|uniref:Uncharacterized protein n=1 Tax=Gracilariopsis chorda TaxID=448386 RepID=A0A2V3IYM0_9FLOR|nr:hypothetical protein BWQ96_03107 [Gracilariopsis chorda]|eukprot:PXF47165.1 hypothetical protein BWQ96_03107 [Gracilariopsis chorda]